MVAGMEVDKVAHKVVDMVADMVAHKKRKRKKVIKSDMNITKNFMINVRFVFVNCLCIFNLSLPLPVD